MTDPHVLLAAHVADGHATPDDEPAAASSDDGMFGVAINPPGDAVVWGPFTDRDTAERFAEFATREIDPTRVLPWAEAVALPGARLRDPVGELLAWRSAVASMPAVYEAEHRDQVLTEAADELERIADETEARVAAHYGLGFGVGSAEMVRECARTVRRRAARSTTTTHACPPGNSSLTPCCGRTPFELSRTDRLTYDQAEINCPAARSTTTQER
jgi:hypothetical protein